MSTLFERYKRKDDWLVVEGLPDSRNVRILFMGVSCYAEAYNIQPRLGDSVIDAAFKNLKRPDK